jgi:hypothetical protein
MVSFTPRQLYPRGKSAQYPVDRRLSGSQSWSGRCGEDKNSCPSSQLVAIPTELSRLLRDSYLQEINIKPNEGCSVNKTVFINSVSPFFFACSSQAAAWSHAIATLQCQILFHVSLLLYTTLGNPQSTTIVHLKRSHTRYNKRIHGIYTFLSTTSKGKKVK